MTTDTAVEPYLLGSQCTGAAMLDMAVASLAGPVEHAWLAEVDPDARQVLDYRLPNVKNLGDITAPDGGRYDGVPRRLARRTADRAAKRAARVFARRVKAWARLQALVEIFTSGFPCQGFSSAGKRKGSADERHLWPTGVLPAITGQLPMLVVLENVPGLLTFEQGTVFGQILADLDELDYTVAWTLVGACKVGACHHRHRIYIAATRAPTRLPQSAPEAHRAGSYADSPGWNPKPAAVHWAQGQATLFGDPQPFRWPASGVTSAGQMWALPVETCGSGGILVVPTPRPRDHKGADPNPSRGIDLNEAVSRMLPTPVAGDADRVSGVYAGGNPTLLGALLPTPRATDVGTPGRRASEGWRPPLSEVLLNLLPTPTANLGRSTGTPSKATAEARFAQGKRYLDDAVALLPTPVARDFKGANIRNDETSLHEALLPPHASDADQRGSSGDPMLPAAVQPQRFGKYAAAVHRHELAFSLVAPDPTEPGRNGKPRLAAAFPEWMMGLPPGWLTEVVERKAALKIAGNGVVWQAAAHALSTLPTTGAALDYLRAARAAVAA